MAVDITKRHAKFFLNTCKKKCKNRKKHVYLSLFFCSTINAVFFFTDILPVIVKDWCSEKTFNPLLPY
jgi:hypothetical protein